MGSKRIKFSILILIIIVIALVGCSYETNSKNLSKVSTNSSDSKSSISEDIEEAVSQTIKSRGEKGYGVGEVGTEGHVILELEEKDGIVKAYTISSFGYFGFENNVFTKVSGSGAIPTVMTFSKNTSNGYSLIEYKEPIDGDGNLDSIKDMFPKRLWDKVLSSEASYKELVKLQEAQAKEYLKTIGRSAEVKADFVDRPLPNINVSASNKLFAEIQKDDLLQVNCPHWLGSREVLENGVRVIYETSQSKNDDGYDLISFRKSDENGKVIEESIYKIVGGEPELQKNE